MFASVARMVSAGSFGSSPCRSLPGPAVSSGYSAPRSPPNATSPAPSWSHPTCREVWLQLRTGQPMGARQEPPGPWVVDAIESPHQLDDVRLAHGVVDGMRPRAPLFRAAPLRRLGRQSFKEERDRHVQCMAELIQHAGADTVRTVLILLDLLVGVADVIGKGSDWLSFNSLRRTATRCPTWMSTGSGSNDFGTRRFPLA